MPPVILVQYCPQTGPIKTPHLAFCGVLYTPECGVCLPVEHTIAFTGTV